MTGINKAILVGHLGADPDIRRTQDGRPVASFSVATSETWRDKVTGERKESTDWHRVVIFNEALARVAEQYLKKGSKVYLEGRMKTRKWTDQGGVDRWVTEVVLQAFGAQLVLLDRREGVPQAEGEGDYGTPRARPDDARSEDPARPGVAPRGAGLPPKNSGGIMSDGAGAELDDEIPF